LLPIIMLVVFMLFSWRAKDMLEYDYLKDPQFGVMLSRNVISIEAKGDPNVVGKKVFGMLYGAFYRLKGKYKMSVPAPRVRWDIVPGAPKSEWTGVYALPVSEKVTPEDLASNSKDFQVKLDKWEYGDVAEILHIGPYSEETPAIERLHKFIQDRGYVITGKHEEDYIKGPGMFIMGDPHKYMTIIRYRVAKSSVKGAQ